MKIKTGDIYREQIPRYEFSKKYSFGKILDITYGKFMDYAKSELFLESAKEVWSLDLLDDKQFVTLRKLGDNKEIEFQIRKKNELDDNKFNLIMGFNTLSVVDNTDETLKEIVDLMDMDSILILSVLSKDLSVLLETDLSSPKIVYFSKSDLENHLKKYFREIIFYSQEYMPEINISKQKSSKILKKMKTSIRNIFRMILLSSKKLDKFYLKYLQSRYRKLRGYRHNAINEVNKNESINEKYNIMEFDENKKSLFIIAVCKKS